MVISAKYHSNPWGTAFMKGEGGGGDILVVAVVVVLLFYVHSKHLGSCRDGHLT